MIEIADLPGVNATLNATSLVLLLFGYRFVRLGRITAHKRCMLAAFGVSMAFLVSYVTYHTLGQEKRFSGQGWIRPVYFSILISHVLLAATVPILACRTLYLALLGRIEKHRRIARFTLPIWLYVSVTGVLIYGLLYRLYP